MAEDREMARQKLGFPLLVGGHDHDPYIEEIEGCHIVKTGCDAVNAAIVDLVWESEESGAQPTVTVKMVKVREYAENRELAELVAQRLQIVKLLDQAYLCDTPRNIQLSSVGMRRAPSTVGTFLCSLVRDGFRCSTECDGVMMDAGAIRRNFDYPADYPHFTFGDLKKEVPFDTEMVVVSMRGAVIAKAVSDSRARAFKNPPEDWGGYLQLDDGFTWDPTSNCVTNINHELLDVNRDYHIGVVLLSLNGMNCNQTLIKWANDNPEIIPNVEAASKAKDLVVACCSAAVLSRLGDFQDLDKDGDGELSVEEVRMALSGFLKRDVPMEEASNFMESLDKDRSNTVSKLEYKAGLHDLSKTRD